MQIKTFSFAVFLSAILVSFNSSGQTWYWTSQADSSNSQTASQVAVDRKNNPVYTGYCNGTRMAFGNIGIDITGSQDDFLAKYNSQGVPLWARAAKALNVSSYTYGMSVATDQNNAVIEAGYFSDSIAFASYHLHSNGFNDNSYIVKYDANGNVLWATCPRATKSSNCENLAYTIAADKQNNILVTGYFEDTAIFGNDTLLAANTINMFLVKYNSVGSVIWARTATLSGASPSAYGLSVATDDSCNVYVGGNISGTVAFGSTPPLTGSGNVYLAKYDSTGKAKWALNTNATPGSEYPTPVVVDRSNNVYIGAQFNNISLTFGHSTVTDGASPCSNSLIAKYDPNGNPLWAACADYISNAEVCVIIESSAATDRCNNVYWSGLCSDSFGVGNVKVTIPGGNINQSTPFAYVIQLDSNGNAIAGAALANQNGNSFSNYMAVDSLSKALFASELVSPDTLVVGNDTVKTYLNNSTCFLSKFAVVPAIINNKNNDTICAGDSITLKVVQVVGSTYKWSNGSTRTSITVAPPVTTSYFVAINNGCIIDTSFIKVTVRPGISARIHGLDSICKGSSIELVGSGGGTYKWSNNKTTDSINVTPDSTTTYSLTTTKAGCTKDTTFTVHILPLPTPTVTTVPSNDSICAGDSILLKGSGGVTYTWSNGKTTSNIWVKALTNTTYTLHVSDGRCSDSATIKVKIIPPITDSIVASKDTICPHQTVIITAIKRGGAATYRWNNGSTMSFITVNDTVTTKHFVTIFGPCNSLKDSITITVIPLATPVITGTSSKCLGAKDTLKVRGGSSYLWGNGSTADSIITDALTSDTTVTITAYNSLGCPSLTSFKVNIFPAPNFTISDTNTCFNNPVTIYAQPTGAGPFTYSWSPGKLTNSSITVPDSGQSYTVTVSNGCVSKQSIHLSPIIPSLSACCDKIIFQGDDTTIVAYGGSGMKSYVWSPAVTCLNPPYCDTVQVHPTTTTTYTVTGTDSSGCQVERIVTIVVDIPCFDLIVPNVFTPSEPGIAGLDNLFYIKTTNINAWSILIYDRWGKEMFKSNDPFKYWDGTAEGGGQAPAGVYYYIIDGTCQGTTYKRDGFVQLIR